MAHYVPKELKGEERILQIPYCDIYFNKKGIVYNGLATLISAAFLYLTNMTVFIVMFALLNIIAYPLAHFTTSKSQFEAGNVKYDLFLQRWLYYRRNKKIYLRRR